MDSMETQGNLVTIQVFYFILLAVVIIFVRESKEKKMKCVE